MGRAVVRRAHRYAATAEEGRQDQNIGVLLAVSTVLAARLSATDGQIRAKVNSTSTPAAASHASGPTVGREPRPSAMPTTTARPISVWITLPTT